MSKKTVSREDIEIYQLVDTGIWRVIYSGVASDNKPLVWGASSASAGEALLLLEEALNEQGYEVRG